MNGVCYTINSATMQADIIAALTDRYGEYHATDNPGGYEQLYQATNYLIFKCPSFADDKVILFRFYSTAGAMSAQYGTGYTGGTSVTDAKSFLADATYTNHGSAGAARLVLHDETLFFASGGSRGCAFTLVIGALSNGQYGGAGFSGAFYDTSSNNTCHGSYVCNLSTLASGSAPLFSCPTKTKNGDIYTQPLITLDESANVAEDANGDPVCFKDVINIAHEASGSDITVGSGFVISVSRLGTPIDQKTLIRSSLLSHYDFVGEISA